MKVREMLEMVERRELKVDLVWLDESGNESEVSLRESGLVVRDERVYVVESGGEGELVRVRDLERFDGEMEMFITNGCFYEERRELREEDVIVRENEVVLWMGELELIGGDVMKVGDLIDLTKGLKGSVNVFKAITCDDWDEEEMRFRCDEVKVEGGRLIFEFGEMGVGGFINLESLRELNPEMEVWRSWSGVESEVESGECWVEDGVVLVMGE